MKEKPDLIFAAGGAVRDLLLGRSCHDVDYVFAGPEEDFIQRNPSARKIENRHSALYLLHGQEFSPLPDGGDGLEPAIARDLLRRDFTVNALLLSQDGVLRAHPQALADLRSGLIRPASENSLAEDPVRVFRAARFSAQLPEFRLHEGCRSRMRALGTAGGLASIAPEQVGKEVLKACAGPKPGNFLRSLHATGCLEPWFQEFAAGGRLPAGPPPYHNESVLEHSAEVMDRTAGTGLFADRVLTALAVWMALCHDLGKTATPEDILPRHIGHEERGRQSARALGLRLRLPSLFVKAGALASALHMKAARYVILRPGTRVDLLTAMHAAHLTLPFLAMVAADSRQPRLPELMQRDLDAILAVKLPPELRGQGHRSGERLRQMRCDALARAPRQSPSRVFCSS